MQKAVYFYHRQDCHIGFIWSERLGLEVLSGSIYFSLVKYYFVQFSSFPFSIFEEIPNEEFRDFRVIAKVKTTFIYKKIDFTYGNEIA